MTARYRFSMVAALFFSTFLVWIPLFGSVLDGEIEIVRRVLALTFAIIWSISVYGVLSAFSEKISISILGVERYSLTGKKAISWTSIAGLYLDKTGEKIFLVDQEGVSIPINISLDGLPSFLELAMRYTSIPWNVFNSAGIKPPTS